MSDSWDGICSEDQATNAASVLIMSQLLQDFLCPLRSCFYPLTTFLLCEIWPVFCNWGNILFPPEYSTSGNQGIKQPSIIILSVLPSSEFEADFRQIADFCFLQILWAFCELTCVAFHLAKTQTHEPVLDNLLHTPRSGTVSFLRSPVVRSICWAQYEPLKLPLNFLLKT